MVPNTLDPCLFFKVKKGKENELCSTLEGLQGTQVDDTLGTGDLFFEDLEEEESKSLEGKPRVSKLPFKFNGAWIDKNKDSTGYITHQKDYCSSITSKNASQYTAEEFAHLRGKLAYAATTSRPDLAYLNAKLSLK